MIRGITTLLLVLHLVTARAQIGSIQTFDFLNLSQSARSASLGGLPLAVIDDDVNIAFLNPSALNASMDKKLTINHNFHLADISYGLTGISFHSTSLNTSFIVGFQYIDYGEFLRTTETGEVDVPFSASENAIIIGAGRSLNERIRVGVQAKFISSQYENYDASALGLNIALTYRRPDSLTFISFVINNMGFQLDNYDLPKESLPLDVQIGFSRRFRYLPFRLYITAHHLNIWNLSNDFGLDKDPLFIDQKPQTPNTFSMGVDNFFRHFIFGGELYIGANEVFRIRAGYNHNRKKDLSIDGFRSFSGLHFGIGIHINKLHFDYAFGKYHLAGGVNHLSLSIDLKSLFSSL